MSLYTKQLIELKEENEQLVKGLKEVTEDLTSLREENKQLKRKMVSDLEEYQIGTPLCPVELTMTNFEQHKEDDGMWCSPSFYIRSMGYKLCLMVFAGGFYDTTDTHLSLCLSLMEGEYDENLKWPFQEKIAEILR